MSLDKKEYTVLSCFLQKFPVLSKFYKPDNELEPAICGGLPQHKSDEPMRLSIAPLHRDNFAGKIFR